MSLIDLSIVIVSYNVRGFLSQALRTLVDAGEGLAIEIFVVDNGSTDGSFEMVRERFPQVNAIALDNVGFAKGNNRALPLCRGRYVLLINPDTVVHRDTLRRMIEFMDSRPEAGAAGCKILNADGTLQLACRRGFPTPAVAFYKIAGLSNIFPRSQRFGRYNLTFLDPESVQEVDAISGSFMIVRRQTVDEVGLLDEKWFMYAEDLDWCYRIKQQGWKIFYVPTTEIIHFKGESARQVSRLRNLVTFYTAMHIFVRKHFSRPVVFVPVVWLLTLGIVLRGCVSLVSRLFERFFLQIVDSVSIVSSLSLGLMIRYRSGALPPPYSLPEWIMMYSVSWAVWMATFSLSGLYRRSRYSPLRAVGGVLVGFSVIILLIFFFKGYNFSRAVALYTLLFSALSMGGWRWCVSVLVGRGKKLGSERKRVVVIGAGSEGETFLRSLGEHPDIGYEIVGLVDLRPELRATTVQGKLVIGAVDDLPEIVKSYGVDEIVVTAGGLTYSRILALGKTIGSDNVLLKLVPGSFESLVDGRVLRSASDLPLVDVTCRDRGLLGRLFALGGE